MDMDTALKRTTPPAGCRAGDPLLDHSKRKAIFRITASQGGWQLSDNGKEIFVFPERDQAIETAICLADIRANLRYIPALVVAEAEGGSMEVIVDFD